MSPHVGALRRLAPAAVFVLSVVAFLPALQGQFLNWDDLDNFVKNPGYRGLGWAQLKWMWTATVLGHWIPLTWMTLGLNYVLGGMDPWGYHLGNLLLHAANAVLFYWLARRLLAAAFAPAPAAPGGARGAPGEEALTWGAALAALVFALHPLRVESVAWVTERRDVLYAFFFLLAGLAYLRSVAEPDRWLRWRLLSLLALAASLLSKSAAMTLPAALLVVDVYPLRRLGPLGWRRLFWEKVPYAVLAGAGALIALVAVARGAHVTGYGEYGPGARLAMTAFSLVFYPWKWLWPVGLSPLYELPLSVDPLEPRFLFAILALVGVSAALLVLRRPWPAGLAAWAYSALMLLPVSGAVHAGYQLAHDRYSYLSGLGLALLAGGAAVAVLDLRAAGRIGARATGAAAAGAAAVLILLGAASWQQTRVWRDSETLWRTAVALDPICAICHSNLASAVLDLRRYPEAEAAYRRSIALRPGRAPTWNNLGTALVFQERSGEAELAFTRALQLDPGLTGATANLGGLYGRRGRYADAVRVLEEAYRAKPDFPNLRPNLALALRSRGAELGRAGRLEEAAAAFRRALEVTPDDPESLRFLGEALLGQGRVQEALAPLARAVALAPGVPASRLWLARAYLLAGDTERAQAELGALRTLDPAMAAELERSTPDRAAPRR